MRNHKDKLMNFERQHWWLENRNLKSYEVAKREWLRYKNLKSQKVAKKKGKGIDTLNHTKLQKTKVRVKEVGTCM